MTSLIILALLAQPPQTILVERPIVPAPPVVKRVAVSSSPCACSCGCATTGVCTCGERAKAAHPVAVAAPVVVRPPQAQQMFVTGASACPGGVCAVPQRTTTTFRFFRR